MSATTAQRRKQSGRAKAGSASKRVRAGAAKAAKAAEPNGSGPMGKLARTAARKTFKLIARKALESGANVVRNAADRTGAAGREALEAGLSRRLPIQVSIDVAVPIAVAWQEWMESGSVVEGVHRIEDIERDGDTLWGTVAGPRGGDWAAEILDEREQESFAWRSVEGTDCAGLVTFHQLSERLTRIELDLDVLPTNPAEALALSLHVAHRRAEADLRRFKARVEFINPDVYEPELNGDQASQNGGGTHDEDDGADQEGKRKGTRKQAHK